jgi:branched-chain amino acid transport system permease protein
VHDDPLTAECVGLSVTRVRFWLSTGGAAFAAFAGILQTGYLGYVIPSEFGLVEVNAIMLAVILGGTTSVIGPIVGSIVYELVLQWTGALGGYHVAFISGLVLLVLVIKPGGLISVRPDRLWQRLTPTRVTAVPISPVPIPGSPVVSNPERGHPEAADALVLKGVSKSYGKVAVLNTVDLTLRPGQILSVIGPNGAGKTTLLNVASGVVRPDQGTVTCNGTGLNGKPPHVFVRHGVCRTFQNLRFFRQLNVVENLAVGMGWSQVAETLRRFELDDKGKRDPNSMAYGERRKLEIARALNLGGRYILLDEPVAGMNDNEKDYVAELILAARNDGLGILVIEHDLAFVQRVSDTVMTLIAGTVVTMGDFDTAIANPALLEAYFGKPDEELGIGMEDGYPGMSSDGLALPGASAPQAVAEWPEPHCEAIGGVTPLPQSNIQGKDMK